MPQTGRKRRMVEFSRAIMPQKSPKRDQRRVVWGFNFVNVSLELLSSPMPRMRSASTMIAEKRKAVRAMSQTQWTAYWSAAG